MPVWVQIITSTIHQLLSPALEYAKVHAADRTAEALSALADPEESSFVLGVAASTFFTISLSYITDFAI